MMGRQVTNNRIAGVCSQFIVNKCKIKLAGRTAARLGALSLVVILFHIYSTKRLSTEVRYNEPLGMPMANQEPTTFSDGQNDTENKIRSVILRPGALDLNNSKVINKRNDEQKDVESCTLSMKAVYNRLFPDATSQGHHDSSSAMGDLRQLRSCKSYFEEGYLDRIVKYNIMGHNVSADSRNVTLVTQLSVGRLDRVEMAASLWKGCMSIAVDLTQSEVLESLLLPICRSKHLRYRTNIHFHIVLHAGIFYPVNYLRNVALDGARTDYVFLADVDMMPMPAMDDMLYTWLQANQQHNKTAWVVPAFETKSSTLNLPESKAKLKEMLRDKTLGTFLSNYIYAYKATAYTKWLGASEPYTVRYEEDFEPYVVVKKSETPRYDNTFLGRIRDKVSHAIQLHLSGMEFVVLPHLFVVHRYHADRSKIVASAAFYKTCAARTYNAFMTRMMKKYPEKQLTTDTFLPKRRRPKHRLV